MRPQAPSRGCQRCGPPSAHPSKELRSWIIETSNHHGLRRSFLDAAGRLAPAGWPPAHLGDDTAQFHLGQRPARTRPGSAGVVDRLDSLLVSDFGRCGGLGLGLTVAGAALAGGVDIVEIGIPLLKTQGVATSCPPSASGFPMLSCWQT